MTSVPRWSFEAVDAEELRALESALASAEARQPPGTSKAATLADAAGTSAAGTGGAATFAPAEALAKRARRPLAALTQAPGEASSPPPLRFAGRVEVAATAAEVDAVVASLRTEGPTHVGFDLEWRVTYATGQAPQPAALVQLCLPGRGNAKSVVYLLQIAHTGVTAALRALLEDGAIAKCGVGATLDAYKLGRDFGLTMAGVVDCSELANTRILPLQRWSLAALTERLLGRRLAKPNGLRTGCWDARVLSAEQKEYAALDAWASLRVYEALLPLPPLPPPPPPPALLPIGSLDQQPHAAAGDSGDALTPAVASPAAIAPSKLEVSRLHLSGMSVASIAAARSIKPVTAKNYLCDAIEGGHAYVWRLCGVAPEHAALVDATVVSTSATACPLVSTGDAQADARNRLKALKAALPEAVTFFDVRLVLAHRRRQNAAAPST